MLSIWFLINISVLMAVPPFEVKTSNPKLRRFQLLYGLATKSSRRPGAKEDGRAKTSFDDPSNKPRLPKGFDSLPDSTQGSILKPIDLSGQSLLNAVNQPVPVRPVAPKVPDAPGGKGLNFLKIFTKRQIAEQRFTGNDANHLYSYLGEFQMGSPSQTLRLLMDTGSSRLWVRGEGQCNPDATECRVYRPHMSSTFRHLNEGAHRITYGDGSFVDGDWVTDSVTIGAYTSENFKFQLGTTVNDPADEDGIFGFGFSTNKTAGPTLWESLIMQTIPDSPVFSVYIDETETSGGFIVGGVDLARYKGYIIWSSTKMAGVYWSLEILKMSVGSIQINYIPGLSAVIDTGTSLAIFPHQVADDIKKALNLQRINLGSPSDNYVGFPCENGWIPDDGILPNLEIMVDKQILFFSPKEYFFIFPDNNDILHCVLGVVGSDMNHVIIGNLFLRKYYVVFDQWFRKIGFATPNRAANVVSNFQGTSYYKWWLGQAAIQIEGAWNESRSPSVWDTFLQSGNPNASSFGSIDVTADHYHRYESDLAILKTLGATMYRFSFSWSRILPDCNGTVNEDAMDHYSKVIDSIIANGAEPVATMHHWDLPASCMTSYNGWAAKEIVNDFVNYADVLLSRFSGKVKYWLTMNEPSNICILGYGTGKFAPNLNLGLEGQYKCGHYSVLATAYTIQLAKSKYPGVIISYPLVSSFGEPLDPNDQKDIDAGIRSMEFTVGWFLDPFLSRDYPASMRTDPLVGPLLPEFTNQDKDALSLGLEFLGINYYTSYYIYYSESLPGKYGTTGVRKGVPIGPVTGIEWQYTFPQGLDKLLKWIDAKYPSKSIWITELGCAAPNEPQLPLHEIVKDDFRINFLDQHLQVIMNSSASIYAVLIWSLLDNWEWQYGYNSRFGVVAVDFNNGTLSRTIKSSGYWLKDYFTANIPSKPLNPSKPSNPAKNSASEMKFITVTCLMLLIIFI